MRPLLIGLVIVIGFAPRPVGLAQTPAPPAQKVQLTFEKDGMVTLVTNGASLREILNEWQAKGGTKFNGAERLTATGLTVQFEHRPEAEVMGSLLRTASGVMVAPNLDNPAAASTIASVFIIATSNATTTTGGYAPTQTYSSPQPQVSTVGSPDQEIPPAGPGRGNEPPPAAAAQQPARPYGGVAVQVVPVPTATVPTAGGSTPPPTNPPATGTTTTTTGGRGGGGGGR